VNSKPSTVLRGVAEGDGPLVMATRPDFTVNRQKTHSRPLGPTFVAAGIPAGIYNRIDMTAVKNDPNVSAFTVTLEATYDDPNDTGANWFELGSVDEASSTPFAAVVGTYPHIRVSVEDFVLTDDEEPGGVDVYLNLRCE
jgi:hypothetical protein